MTTDNTHAVIDRFEIADLASRFGAYLDTTRIDDLGDIFTADVITRFPVGEQERGLDLLQTHARTMLEQWWRTQHVITNVVCDLHGGRAQVRANVIATHVRDPAEPATYWAVGGHYDFEARRTADGWRFCSMVLNATWTTGERQSPRS
jgi:hypothetical protein